MKRIPRLLLPMPILPMLLAVPSFAATFQWQRTSAPETEGVTFSGLWDDPGMWIVSGSDDDGIPDADDTVRFGTQKSGSGMLVPTFSGTAACYKMDIALRTDAWVAFTMKFKNGTLRLGAGGLNIHEGNEWQDASRFEGSFSVELTADQVWEHRGSNFHADGPVHGPYAITMRGDSRYLNLNNANSTFSGGLIQESGPTLVGKGSTVTDGVLVKGPLGTGPVVLKGGKLTAIYANQTLYNAVTFSGSAINFGDGGWENRTLTFADDVTDAFVLAAEENGATRTISATRDATLRRTVSESGAARIRLQKTGGAKLTLAGSSPNTFSGGVAVADGQLVAAKDGACGAGDVSVSRSDANSTAAFRIASGVVSAIADDAALRLASYSDGDTANHPVVTLDGGVVEKVAALYLDGVPQADNLTYGGPDSQADVVLADWFAGSGVVRVARPATVIFVL